MSRAYRIRVSETLRRIIKADDHVRTQLEILNVLPAGDMADLLGEELLRRGFKKRNGQFVRRQDDIEVLVDGATASVTVQAAACDEVKLQDEQDAWSLEKDHGQLRKITKEKLKKRLAKEATEMEKELQSRLTDKLAAQLGDIRQELDRIANQVTAAALKRKAAQLGKIKEIDEDQESGSMTIVLEV